MERIERKRKLGNGPIAILNIHDLGIGRQVKMIVSGKVTDVNTSYFSATHGTRYPRKVFRMGENDMSDVVAEGADGKKLIFSEPQFHPSVEFEASEN